MPRVSVIIPTYNGTTRFLDQALASVEAQTFQDFELILVDDASTDGTLQYAQTCIPAHRPVIYHQRERNGGPSAARNDGAKRATGEFLAFLDQDDMWDPTFLETTVTRLHALPAHVGFLHTADWWMTTANQALDDGYRLDRPKNLFAQLLMGGVLRKARSGLFRKTAFEAVHGFDERLRYAEDMDLGIRLCREYEIVTIPDPLYRFRQDPNSAAKTTAAEYLFESRIRFLEKHAGACRHNPCLQKALEDEWATLLSDMGKHYAARKQRKNARQLLRHSLWLAPFSLITWRRYLRTFLRFSCLC